MVSVLKDVIRVFYLYRKGLFSLVRELERFFERVDMWVMKDFKRLIIWKSKVGEF